MIFDDDDEDDEDEDDNGDDDDDVKNGDGDDDVDGDDGDVEGYCCFSPTTLKAAATLLASKLIKLSSYLRVKAKFHRCLGNPL